MKIILKEWLKNKKALFLIILSMVLSGIYSALDSLLIINIKNLFDDIYNANIFWVVCIFISMIILDPIIYFIQRYAIDHTRTKMLIRWNSKILESDFNMFTKYSCATISTVENFIHTCSGTMRSIIYLVRCIITIVATVWGMYMLGGKIAIVLVIIVYGIAPFIFKYLISIYKKIDDEIHVSIKRKNQLQENIVYGFSEVRLFGKQIFNLNEIKDVLENIFKLALKRCVVNGKINMAFKFINAAGVFTISLYCLSQMKMGYMTSTASISLVLYVLRIIDPLEGIMDVIDGFSESIPAAKDFKEIMNYKNNLHYGNIQLEDFNNSIEIKNLSFEYEKSSLILKNINMNIQKGQRIGIVGASGNGKSTLAKLLLHFYEATRGSILIDNIDIKDITDESFRKLVGSVQQENTIFPGSVLSNITYGSENAMENEIIKACKKAHIYDFIMSLPDKFNTELGPRGLELSGGQKQRIALARLFLKNPQIIILDEATSALDNGTETLIQDAINELDRNSTVITIAHRLSTIKDCDVIYVIDNHTIAESGNHDQLVAAKGIYYKMSLK